MWFLVPVLVLQVVMFFVIRNKKKQWKKNNILDKYGVATRSDLFQLLQNPHLTDEDRDKLQAIYEKGILN